MTRRDALALMGGTALTVRAAEPALTFTNLDHVEFFTKDVERSIGFYARIFGNTVSKNNRTTRRYLKLGSAYLAMDNAGQAGLIVDHICAGIPGFDVAKMHDYLRGLDIPYRDYPSGRDLAVSDPDGTRLQLAGDHGWTCATGPSSRTSATMHGPTTRPTPSPRPGRTRPMYRADMRTPLLEPRCSKPPRRSRRTTGNSRWHSR